MVDLSKIETKSGKIIFYCKDCNEIVDTSQVRGKYVYTCNKCGTKNVAFGSEKSIKNFFRIEDEEEEVKKEEVEGEKN